jgi:hypothetical protein
VGLGCTRGETHIGLIVGRMEYIAAGANRHPEAADWCGDVLAFGSGRNVALWNMLVRLMFLILSTFSSV